MTEKEKEKKNNNKESRTSQKYNGGGGEVQGRLAKYRKSKPFNESKKTERNLDGRKKNAMIAPGWKTKISGETGGKGGVMGYGRKIKEQKQGERLIKHGLRSKRDPHKKRHERQEKGRKTKKARLVPPQKKREEKMARGQKSETCVKKGKKKKKHF